MSSMTRNQILSQQLLYQVPPLFVKRAKEKQHCILEVVSRYIVHLKIGK